MKPFIKIADHYVNVSSIAYIKTLSDGALWIAFDASGATGIRVEKDAAPEFERQVGLFVAFTVEA